MGQVERGTGSGLKQPKIGSSDRLKRIYGNVNFVVEIGFCQYGFDSSILIRNST